MKKTIFIILKIFTNLFLILVILLLFEFSNAYISFNHNKDSNETFIFKLRKTIINSKLHYKFLKNYNYTTWVRPIKIDYDLSKPPVILMGCSYTYGDGLKNEEAFHSVLSDYTKRNTINLGICCASPKDALFILRDEKTKKELLNNTNKAEYVIYTYITDQKRRLYISVCQYRLSPNFVHDKNYTYLKYKKQNLIMSASFSKNFITALYYDKYLHLLKKDSKLLMLYFKELNKEIQKNFTNSKGEKTQLIILVYNDYDKEDWSILEKEGIKVINVDKLAKINSNYYKYILPNFHPNAKAWQDIVPALAKELNL